MKRFLRLPRIFTLRGAFRVATLATLIAGFYIIENWRGERAWVSAEARLRAAGEPVTIDAWLPEPLPDDQNFMFNPVFVRHHGLGQASSTELERFVYPPCCAKGEDGSSLPFPYEALGYSDGTGAPDMVAIASVLPETLRPPAGATQQQAAHAVLQWTGQWDSDFEALTEAVRTRPMSQILWLREANMAPRREAHSGWMDMAKVLQLRALAQATAGDGKGALDSISLMLHLGRAVAAEPEFMFEYVLSVATTGLVLAPLNHCLATHIWMDTELASLGNLIDQIDFRADFRRGCRGERFYFSRMVEEMVAGGGQARQALDSVRPRVPASVLALFPRGWWRQNQVRVADWQLEVEQRLRVPAAGRPESNVTRPPSPLRPYEFLFGVFMKGVFGVEKATDTIEAQFLLVRLALALERHRLAHGSYPDTLSGLAALFPNGEPSDPFSGKPPRYVLVNGQPRLWSVGPNQLDDGGREDSKGADDIVWAYPAE